MSSSSPPSPPATVVVAPSRSVVSLESKSIASPTFPIVAVAAAATASTGSARCGGKPQETNSKVLLHRRCRRQKKYRSHVQALYDRHVLVIQRLQVISRPTRKVGMLTDKELDELQAVCAGFGAAFRIAYPKRGGLLTLKGTLSRSISINLRGNMERLDYSVKMAWSNFIRLTLGRGCL